MRKPARAAQQSNSHQEAHMATEKMSRSRPVCVFCSVKNNKIKLFVENTLKKCHELLKIRKLHKLDQIDVVLPEKINKFEGYHSTCYAKFTAVSKKYRESVFSSTQLASQDKS